MNQCCGHDMGSSRDEAARVRALQSRIDDLLAGAPRTVSSKRSTGVFAEFLPADQHRASALAALCAKIAKRIGGLPGLEAAVDRLYDTLTDAPLGMVEYAAKLFLTHYQPARERLLIRSLEERQPATVRPSQELDIISKDRVEFVLPKEASKAS